MVLLEMSLVQDACSTCGCLPPFDQDVKSEKMLTLIRQPCCSRVVCARCLAKNRRFRAYCPYCQLASAEAAEQQSASLPPYSTDANQDVLDNTDEKPQITSARDLPPSYESATSNFSTGAGQSEQEVPDLTHYLRPEDSVMGLSLAYGIPGDILRRHNNMFSDHLLSARKTISIPGEYNKGAINLSPDPVEDPEEEERKSKIRKLMVKCKIAEYDVAILYLEQDAWDLQSAMLRYEADEKWAADHPLNKGKRLKGLQVH